MTGLCKRVATMLSAVLLAGWTAGCIDMPPLDPPSLQLQSDLVPRTPSNLPRGDYTLTNGAGETLLEAKDVAPEQQHEARFDQDKLDGTINITVTKDGQTIYTQKLEHTPGEPVRLKWDIEFARFLLAEPEAPRSGSRTGGDGGGGGRD